MKMVLEVPDRLFREVKAAAAERSQPLKEFVAEALRDKLALESRPACEPEWMQGFGKLKHLHKETVRVQSVIDQEFDVIEPEDRH
jgi:hypothetical protein